MAKGDGFPDPVSEAFRRVSQEAGAKREAGAPPAHQPIDWVIAALFVFVLVLGAGIPRSARWLVARRPPIRTNERPTSVGASGRAQLWHSSPDYRLCRNASAQHLS